MIYFRQIQDSLNDIMYNAYHDYIHYSSNSRVFFIMYKMAKL